MKEFKMITGYIILAVFFMMGCSTNEEGSEEMSESESLYEEVIALHNQVMPQMSEAYNLKTSLQEQLQELDSLDDDYEKIQQTIAQLDQADEGMREWMRNFKKPDPETVEKTVIEYYKTQKERIESVQKTMDEAMAAARELLKPVSE